MILMAFLIDACLDPMNNNAPSGIDREEWNDWWEEEMKK
jgi:hypothetical protein